MVNHKRKQIVRWVWMQLRTGKKNVVELEEIEDNFKCFCEHIMMEAVLKGFFKSTSTRESIGWYLSEEIKTMSPEEVTEKLNNNYKVYM